MYTYYYTPVSLPSRCSESIRGSWKTYANINGAYSSIYTPRMGPSNEFVFFVLNKEYTVFKKTFSQYSSSIRGRRTGRGVWKKKCHTRPVSRTVYVRLHAEFESVFAETLSHHYIGVVPMGGKRVVFYHHERTCQKRKRQISLPEPLNANIYIYIYFFMWYRAIADVIY